MATDDSNDPLGSAGAFLSPDIAMHRGWLLCRPMLRNFINTDGTVTVTVFMLPAAAEENIFINRKGQSLVKELPIE